MSKWSVRSSPGLPGTSIFRTEPTVTPARRTWLPSTRPWLFGKRAKYEVRARKKPVFPPITMMIPAKMTSDAKTMIPTRERVRASALMPSASYGTSIVRADEAAVDALRLPSASFVLVRVQERPQVGHRRDVRLVRRADERETGVLQERDTVGHEEGRRDVVRHEDGRRAEPFVQVGDQAVDRHRRDRVEAGRRLVVEEDVRLQGDGPRERHALLHPARERGREEPQHVAPEVDEAEHLDDARLDLCLAHLRVLAEREGDVLEDRHRVEERAALEEHSDLLAHAPHLLFREVGDVLAVHEDAPLVRVVEAVHLPERYGFPLARSAEAD